MVLTLYKLDPSPPARAAMMAAEALGLPVNYVDINLFQGEHKSEDYLKKNPLHTIPTLEDDDFIVWDSHAIAGYLATTYGKNDSLYPTEPRARAVVDQRLYFDTGVLFPRIGAVVGPVAFKGETSIPQEALDKIDEAYGFLEIFLGENKYLAGQQLTIADICCVASTSTLNEFLPIEESKYPNLSSWLERMSQEPFYQRCNAPGCALIGQLIKSKINPAE